MLRAFTCFGSRGALQPPPRPAGAVGDALSALDPGGLTVFEAIEKQLGLKLQRSKEFSDQFLVIDHIERHPSGN